MFKITLITLAFALTGVAMAEPLPQGRAALEKWMQTSAKVRTVQADFEQVRMLATVRKPLTRPGKLWMERDGAFRWQVGEVPGMIVLRNKAGDVEVLDTKKKERRLWSATALADEGQAGGGQGFAMLTALQDVPNLAEFEKRFEIKAAERDAKSASVWRFDLSLKDRKASQFVRLIQLTVDVEKGALLSLVMQMRDGSTLATNIRTYRLNEDLDSEVFRVDTAGYEVKNME